MEYRTLGRSELRVSSIGLGCVTFGREIPAGEAIAVLDRALESGINLLDTAEAYAGGRSEEIVGQWLAKRRPRHRLVVATKLRPPLTREHIMASVEDSLRRLRIDCIDLFYVHAWDSKTALEESLSALADVVRQGKARYLGCSNFAAWQLCKALWQADVRGWPRFEACQPNYNLIVRDIEREMLPLCADQGIGLVTFSPLGGGFLTGKYRPDQAVPAGSRMDVVPGMMPSYFHPQGFRTVERLQAKAQELGVPVTTLALAWVLSAPGLCSTLVGARSPAHVDQALAADAFRMSGDLRAELSA